MSLPTESLPPEPPSRTSAGRRHWYWLLGICGGVIAVLVLILVGLNLYRSQNALTPERVRAAKQKWETAGLKNYDITVTTTGGTRGTYWVEVRDNAVLQATQNNVPFGDQIVKAHFWTVSGLFGVLEQDLQHDANPKSPRYHTEISFDEQRGYPTRYLRVGPGIRILLEVELHPK